jgi:D-alanyl-D-alanine carboxypeptidase (penicillin-binding protein 5/6)
MSYPRPENPSTSRFRSRRWRIPSAILAGALVFLANLPAAQARHRHKPASNCEPREVSKIPTPGQFAVAAQGAIVIDAFTGKSCFEKNADKPFYPASTTKILTALLVIEEGNLDKEVVIELPDTQVEPSAIEFHPGERYTRRELLYALLLKSANDVAQALARDNAGSIQAFAEKMTKRAAELGAVSSHFMNPHGLHNPQHYTTPRDLCLIARAAMQQPLFRQIVSTQTHTWPSPGCPVHLTNHNRLLGKFPGCTGIKTGYTVPAQQVLASAALWGTREAISIVMHTDKPGIWEDSKAMLTKALEEAPPDESIQSIPSIQSIGPAATNGQDGPNGQNGRAQGN